ncbi:uncharacterized protein LOC114879051 [Osmia bicornis bicornis]|uniref:uncharacterized protein LOC114879051 n=1 Tax=Osmia bicornis bicornis TaxID=1437191 RepID=UPI0010F7C5D5|nr:uncharacterized protein LOC114879051 [Osmia bicornis bicornis]
MKSILILCCTCLIISSVIAGVPLTTLEDSQSNLSKSCQIPKCPEASHVEDQGKTVNLPYPLDCLQYVECKGSEARILPCPPDEIFDQNTSSCGPRDKVRCVPCYQQG